MIIGNYGGEGFQKPKLLKESMKLAYNFQREGKIKSSFLWEWSRFSGTR